MWVKGSKWHTYAHTLHELFHKLKLLLQKNIPSVEHFSIDEFFADATGWIKDKNISLNYFQL